MASAVGYSRIFALLVTVLVALHSGASQAAFAPLSRRDDLTTEVFSPSDLCRIWGSTSVLINSTMWVDGGLVSVQVCNKTGGESSNCTTWKDINNYLFAISFEKAFSAVDWPSLSYKAIRKPKSVPQTIRGVLWRNKPGTELYKFGGHLSENTTSTNYNSTADVAQIWSYGTDSNTWTDMSPALSNSWDLQYCSVLPLDRSFAFGTWDDASSVSKSTMITLDTVDSVSTRVETSNTLAGAYDRGVMLHLPVQGGEGILLFIGGFVAQPSGSEADVPMDFVHLYDITSSTWFNQSTSTDSPTGVFPNPRHNFCASLVSTGSKSFDIFMYGGDFNKVEGFSTSLWILSIPSFRWFYFSDPDTHVRLSGSTCQVIGSHFIRFGGWNYYNPSTQPYSGCLNSISIFDLNSFNWTDSFDPATPAYVSPGKVTAWNAKNQAPVGGWDSGVQALFAGLNGTSTTTSNPSASSATAKPTPRKLPGILGGILGGLAGIAFVLVGVLFFLKRKKEQHAEIGPDQPAELPADGDIISPPADARRKDSPDIQM